MLEHYRLKSQEPADYIRKACWLHKNHWGKACFPFTIFLYFWVSKLIESLETTISPNKNLCYKAQLSLEVLEVFRSTSLLWNLICCQVVLNEPDFTKQPIGDGNPVVNYMFNVNNRNTRTRFEICLRLTIKTPKRSFWCFYC